MGLQGGLRMEQNDDLPKILFNCARCRKCGSIIESTHVHDFRMCTCGAIGVDGGLEYIRRIGELEDCEELSEFDLMK